MNKGLKIGLALFLLAGIGVVIYSVTKSSTKSGVKSKDDRRITFTKK